MNVGIVVYSKTGNSLSVAEKVKKDLERKGFSVTMLAIEASGEGPNTKIIMHRISVLMIRLYLHHPFRLFLWHYR